MGKLTVGIDLVDVRQVEETLARFGEHYVSRVYTAAEASYAREAPPETARRLSARFAAKEATIKALCVGDLGIDPRSIEVVRTSTGCEVVLTGSALVAARRARVKSLSLSMSHEGNWAAATVIAERGRAGAPPERSARARQKDARATSPDARRRASASELPGRRP